MNGRVYDPTLGRFLSADPHIDDEEDAQAFNRYSYVSNNPLGYTDPSGYFKLKDALKIVGAIVVGYFTAGLAAPWIAGIKSAFWAAVAKGAAFGFGSGFAGSLLNGGSIGDAFKAGVIGAIQGGLAGGVGNYFNGLAGSKLLIEGGRALAHGVVGGLAAEAMGGEFRHGFYAGAAGSIGGSIAGAWIGTGSEPWRIAARTIVAAVAGGTAAELGGGKFANGAMTAAMQHLVNHESSYLEDVATTFSGYALGFWEGVSGFSAGDGSMGSISGDQGRSTGQAIGKAVQFVNLARGAIAGARYLGSRLTVDGAKALARSGAGFTRSSLSLGQKMHQAYKAGLHNGVTKFKEFRLASGRRIDFLDVENGLIHELKPNNPRAIMEGQKQLQMYLQEIRSMPQFQGINWRTVLDTY